MARRFGELEVHPFVPSNTGVPELVRLEKGADAHAAWQGLDDATRDEVAGLDAVHDDEAVFGSRIPAGEQAKVREQYPLVEHPVVCRHPQTGRELLYVNRFFVKGIVGLDVDAGRALVDRLCRQFDQLEYQCRFQWEPHSVAFWDNRAVQHCASVDYWPDIRVMERASVVGGRPAR